MIGPESGFPSAKPRRFIYIAIGLLTAAIAIAGFWPTYFGPLLQGTLDKPPVIHVHALVYLAWVGLVILQAWFAATGRIGLHLKVGRIGMAYGIVVIAAGLMVTFAMFEMRVMAGDIELAKRRLFAPLTDMVVFAPLLWAAWAWRHKPEVHKRLMVVATTVLLVAAVHRFVGHWVGQPPPVLPVVALWLLPIAAGMVHDAVRHRRVHPVYVVGIAAILLLAFRRFAIESEFWDNLANWFVTIVRPSA